MDFGWSEELTMIRDTAREVAAKEVAPRAAQADREGRFPMEQFRALAKLGFAGMLIPEEYGGSNLGHLAMVTVMEEVNAACASTGVTLSVHNSLVGSPILHWGSEYLKDRYLPKLATGELLGAYALTEPGAGSDAASLKCKAVKKGDRYVLNGVKAWITTGRESDVVIVFATTDPEARTRGICAFVVEKAFGGVTVGKVEKKLGIRGSSTVQLFLEDCEVPEQNMLGPVGKGFNVAMHTLDGGRVGIAAQAVGIARASLEAATKYSLERKQFGQPISHFQAIQAKLADMSVRLDASRLLVQRAAWLKDQGLPHTPQAAQAKLFASETANFCADQAVQIHGGAGYTVDFPVERYFRDAKITEIYEGTNQIQRVVIARNLTGEGRS